MHALSIGQCGTLACLLEVTAPKVGNVHRGADFEDLTFADFAASAVVIAPALEAAAAGERLGSVILRAVEATRTAVATNTNLGTILLLAPLAAVPRSTPLGQGIGQVLSRLDVQDTRDVYAAIRHAMPGGLGTTDEADVAHEAPPDLVGAMRLAADRDLVARQYANGFSEVLGVALRWLVEGIDRGWPLAETIAHAHLKLMSEYPDSLIARKCGRDIAEQAAARAARVLDAGEPDNPAYREALLSLDFWLRSDHHRRNPGTTADLIVAGLFAGLRDGIITFPLRFYA